MGAADPTSGTVSLHEIVRGYGALLRTGWKPLRTILFASWDAEEVLPFFFFVGKPHLIHYSMVLLAAPSGAKILQSGSRNMP